MAGKRPRPNGRPSTRGNRKLSELKNILNEHKEDLTLIVGNGINLCNKHARNDTWKDILEQIARDRGFIDSGKKLSDTSSLVELIDLLQLHSDDNGRSIPVKAEFCEKLEKLEHGQSHMDITNWAMKHSVPTLTTNFDTTLSDACGAKLVHPKQGSGGAQFSRFYPWSSRFEVFDQPIDKPRNSFAIWHVNGMSRYVESVRLGISDYMGSAHQARRWMQRGDNPLFAKRNAIDRWKGRNTWLDAFFANDLLIFGLGLSRDEVFLRWLLIERARYCRKFSVQDRKAWYVWAKEEMRDSDRCFFLKHVAIERVDLNSYDEIYSSQVWNS